MRGRIRANWNRADTVVLTATGFAFALLVANAWFNSLWLCYLALTAPLLGAPIACGKDESFYRAYAFGAGIGLTWPLAEGTAAHVLGWWGRYLGGGPCLWNTPVYCVLIGWLSCFYLVYLHERIRLLGFGMPIATATTSLSAILLGTLGENLFAWAGMWEYGRADWMWMDVPAFVPVSYGICFLSMPWVRTLSLPNGVVVFNVASALTGYFLGWSTGFYPRG